MLNFSVRFILALALMTTAAHAQKDLRLLGVGRGPASPTFVGDLDTASANISGWWGLEAASAADRGTAAANVCLPADSLCADVHTDATTGEITSATMSAAGLSTCNNTTVICTVKTLYNKGGGADTDASNSSNLSQRPTLIVPGGCPASLSATLYCMFFVKANNSYLFTASAVASTCPCTLMGVYYNTVSSAYQTVAGSSAQTLDLYSASGVLDFYVGSTDQSLSGTALDTWYAAVGTTGASGFLQANGLSTAATAVSSGVTNTWRIGSDTGDYFDGYIFKTAHWNATSGAASVTSGQASTIIANTRSRLGF